MKLRGGEVALEQPLLSLLDLEAIDELHHPDAQRRPLARRQIVRVSEAIEHADRALDLGDGGAREAAGAHAALGEHVPLVRDALAAQRQPQPQLEILSSPDRLVEQPGGGDGVAARDDRREDDVAPLFDQAEERDLARGRRRLHEARAGERRVAGEDRVAVHERARRVRVEIPDLPPEEVALPAIVGVEEREIAAARGADRRVARGAGAAVRLLDVTKTCPERRDRRAQRLPVRRSVVDDDGLDVGKGLLEDGSERVSNILARSIRGDDHGDCGLGRLLVAHGHLAADARASAPPERGVLRRCDVCDRCRATLSGSPLTGVGRPFQGRRCTTAINETSSRAARAGCTSSRSRSASRRRAWR